MAIDMKLELVPVPVSDVDRAIAFYKKVGFSLDHDVQVNDDLRFVQLTPPGSACSIMVGTGITRSEPGSLQGPQLVVDDIEAARAELIEQRLHIGRIDGTHGAIVIRPVRFRRSAGRARARGRAGSQKTA